MSKNLVHVGLGLNLDDAISFIHGLDIPGKIEGLPDLVNVGSLYSNDNDGTLWRKISSGTGSTKWIKLSDSDVTVSSTIQSGVTSVDSIDSSLVGSVKWILELQSDVNPSNRYISEIIATHNGTTEIDATEVYYSSYGILNSGLIPNLDVYVSLDNSLLNLKVNCSESLNVLVRRVLISSGQSPYVVSQGTSSFSGDLITTNFLRLFNSNDNTIQKAFDKLDTQVSSKAKSLFLAWA